MKEDFVTYELAVKLSKKGFNIDTDFCYNQDGGIVRVGTYPAPQIHEVLKWFRKEKRIDAGAVWDNRDGKWVGYVNEMDMPDLVGEYVLSDTYVSYEHAALTGIEYVIDNLI